MSWCGYIRKERAIVSCLDDVLSGSYVVGRLGMWGLVLAQARTTPPLYSVVLRLHVSDWETSRGTYTPYE